MKVGSLRGILEKFGDEYEVLIDSKDYNNKGCEHEGYGEKELIGGDNWNKKCVLINYKEKECNLKTLVNKSFGKATMCMTKLSNVEIN